MRKSGAGDFVNESNYYLFPFGADSDPFQKKIGYNSYLLKQKHFFKFAKDKLREFSPSLIGNNLI